MNHGAMMQKVGCFSLTNELYTKRVEAFNLDPVTWTH